jgi:L-amino acid N-acyltransferase YncA
MTTTSNPATTIRHATLADVDRIAAIHVDAWRATQKKWADPTQPERISVTDRLELWQGVIVAGTWPVLVAENADVLIGFAHVLPCRDPDRDPRVTGELSAIYLAPECQRRGYGSALLSQALADLSAQGFRSASLWVGAHNHVARRFYQAHGFENDGGTKIFARTGWDGVRYVRSLEFAACLGKELGNSLGNVTRP